MKKKERQQQEGKIYSTFDRKENTQKRKHIYIDV